MLAEAERRRLRSPEHFTIDGTLIHAWAGQKSVQRRGGHRPKRGDQDSGNPSVDFHGERRSNATHQSTTDPEARLAKKGAGHEARLAYQGHVLMENRQGLALAALVTPATGTAERDAAEQLLRALPPREGRRTLGADQGYDTRGCVAALRARRHAASRAKHRPAGWQCDR